MEELNYKEMAEIILKNKKVCPACGSETPTYLYGSSGCNECIGEPWVPDCD